MFFRSRHVTTKNAKEQKFLLEKYISFCIFCFFGFVSVYLVINFFLIFFFIFLINIIQTSADLETKSNRIFFYEIDLEPKN